MTSHPQGRRANRPGKTAQSGPLKGVKVRVTVASPEAEEVARLASSKGLPVDDRGGRVSVAISAPTPEEALAQLEVLAEILSSKT